MMLYRFVGDNTHAMSSGRRHRRNFPLNVVRAMIVRLAPARDIWLPQLVPQHPRKQHAPQKPRVLPGRKTDDLPCRKACVTMAVGTAAKSLVLRQKRGQKGMSV